MLVEVLSAGGTLRLLSRIKRETLFSPFVFCLLVKLFICFVGSHSRLLMPDVTLLLYITGWVACSVFRNLPYDKDFKENNLQTFPYQEDNVNQWFEEQVPCEGHEGRKINMLNLEERPKSDEYPPLNEAVYPPREEDVEGFTMLYHGTRHEYAKSILKKIKLCESKKRNGDFSYGKGFYVTKHFEWAVGKYGFGRSSAKVAVLAFKIPNDVLEEFRKKSKDLKGEANIKEWEYVVKNIRKEAKKYNFIEGPEMKRESGGAKTSKQLPGTYQMCLLKEEMAEAFDAHLHSVVFYNTSRTGR